MGRLEENNKKNKDNIKCNQKKSRKSKSEKNNTTSNKKKSGFRKFVSKVITMLLLIIIIMGVLFYKKTQQNGGGIKGALTTFLGLSVENVDGLETINVLLLGISEDLESKLTDTIILCSYNPKNQSASMLSIPRDTFVGKNKNNAKGSDKINSLYAKSPEKMLKTVSEITGINVEYYAVVKTHALIEIVDIVGGVEFNVPINMDYDDPTQDLHIHLKKGMQKIDGEKAEQLLRFRHNNDGSSYPIEYGDNDFGRMKTQREFITETIKQTLNIKNLLKTKKILDTVFKNIETNLIVDDLLSYIPTMVEFSTDNIISNQLPGASEKCNEIWFFIHNKKETKKIIEKLEYIYNI